MKATLRGRTTQWRPAAFVVTLFALLMAGPVAAHAAVPVATLEKSIVFIGIQFDAKVVVEFTDNTTEEYDATASYTCTGWFADTTAHIVTAGHCVDADNEVREDLIDSVLAQLDDGDDPDVKSYAYKNWKVYGENPGDPIERTVRVIQPSGVDGAVLDRAYTVEVVNYKKVTEGDVALLQIANFTTPTPALPVAAQTPQVGDTINAIGYAGLITDISDPTRLRAQFESGTVSSINTSASGMPQTIVNAPIIQGMSGGPTVDANGNVLGVNSRTFNGVDGLHIITDTNSLRTFLQSNGVTFAAPATTATPGTTTSPRPPVSSASGSSGSSGGDLFGIIGTVIGVLVGLVVVAAIIAILIVVIVRSRKKSASQPDRPLQPVQPLQFTETTNRAICSNGHENAPGSRYCSTCGATIN